MIEHKLKTVLVAKSDKMLNDLLCHFVRSIGLSLVGTVENGHDAIRLLTDKSPTLLITGMDLSGMSGIDLAAWINSGRHPTKVILFSKIKSKILIETVRQSNVHGFMFSDDGLSELPACIDSVLSGRPYLSQNFKNFDKDCNFPKVGAQRSESPQHELTKAEMKVLWYLSNHLSLKEIAAKLFISYCTVNNHLYNVRKKLKLKGNGTLLRYILSSEGKFLLDRLRIVSYIF